MDQYNKDPEIWKMAQERAGFKMHITIYLIGVAFFWIMWAFIGFLYNWEYSHPWPIYPMLLWGLGLTVHYLFVYKWKKKLMVKEYDKLMKSKAR